MSGMNAGQSGSRTCSGRGIELCLNALPARRVARARFARWQLIELRTPLSALEFQDKTRLAPIGQRASRRAASALLSPPDCRW